MILRPERQCPGGPSTDKPITQHADSRQCAEGHVPADNARDGAENREGQDSGVAARRPCCVVGWGDDEEAQRCEGQETETEEAGEEDLES